MRQIDEYRDAPRGLRGLELGVGLGDQFLHIPVGTMEFSQELGEQRIPQRLEEVVFPWIGERLELD